MTFAVNLEAGDGDCAIALGRRLRHSSSQNNRLDITRYSLVYGAVGLIGDHVQSHYYNWHTTRRSTFIGLNKTICSRVGLAIDVRAVRSWDKVFPFSEKDLPSRFLESSAQPG